MPERDAGHVWIFMESGAAERAKHLRGILVVVGAVSPRFAKSHGRAGIRHGRPL
jgi:hypothetical protein